MKIDLAYISELLNYFLDANSAHISILYLQEKGLQIESEKEPGEIDDKFLFHFQLMMENGLISDQDFRSHDLEKMGLILNVSGGAMLVDLPIRLTQKGHDFASALSNKEVLAKLKSELKDAPFKTIFDGSQKLIQHFLKKKLDELVAE